MAVEESGEIYVETIDNKGNPITIFSTDGKLKDLSSFSKALSNYEDGKKPTAGFVTLPTNSMQGRVRTGFEEGPGNIARNVLPKVGEAVGGAAALSPLLMLGQQAGLISPGTANAPIQAGRSAGRATGQFVGEQMDTPAEAGMMLGTAVASPAMKIITSATGALLKAPAIRNFLASVTGATVGAESLRLATGEDITPGQVGEDFAMAALGAGMQGVASHFITKFINSGMQEKVAKGVVDSFKARYPNMSAADNIMDIAGSSPAQISRFTQQMSKGLRESYEEIEHGLITQLNSTLPSSLSVGQQNTVRGGIRRLITAQNKQLDNIGSDEAFDEAGVLVKQRTQELLDSIREMFPKVKNIDPTILRAESVLQTANAEVKRFEQGATVLHYLKQAGADEGFDPMRFAQMIRGQYQRTPGSQLEEVGKILGQGRALTDMPAQQAPPTMDIGGAAINAAKGKWGRALGSLIPSVRDTSPPMPWPTRQLPMQPLINFGAQQAGQDAIRSFLEEKK